MDYFKGITDIEQAKLRYKSLAKQLHPDMGGNVHEFQRMQDEYKIVLLQLKTSSSAVGVGMVQSDEYELLSELGKLARVLVKKQVPQNYLRQKVKTTENLLNKGLLAEIAELLDRI